MQNKLGSFTISPPPPPSFQHFNPPTPLPMTINIFNSKCATYIFFLDLGAAGGGGGAGLDDNFLSFFTKNTHFWEKIEKAQCFWEKIRYTVMTVEIRQKKGKIGRSSCLYCQRWPAWSSRKLSVFRQRDVRKYRTFFKKIWPRTTLMGYSFNVEIGPLTMYKGES